jgi:hypothetical protein
LIYLTNVAKPIGAIAMERRAPPTCSRYKETGHRSTNKACLGRVSQVLADLMAYVIKENVTTNNAIKNNDIISNVIIITLLNISSVIPNSLKYNNPRAIYQRYINAKKA